MIHGTVDPLVRPEARPKDTAASIPGAKLLMIEGMGHALPIPMWPQIIDAIDEHAHGRVRAKAAVGLSSFLRAQYVGWAKALLRRAHRALSFTIGMVGRFAAHPTRSCGISPSSRSR